MVKIGLVPSQRGNNLRTTGEALSFGGPGMVPGLLAAPAMDAMSTQVPAVDPVPPRGGHFATTHWSLVLAAGTGPSPGANEALENLCRTYWHPLYVFIRRRGHGPEDAEDLTQQFFAHFLEKDYFHRADPARGRFRTFLVRSLEHFLVNEWKHEHRLKRGGTAPRFVLDLTRAEQQCVGVLAGGATPDQAYERRWALLLLERVLESVREEYAASQRTREFDELAGRMWGRDGGRSYAEIGTRLGLTENAARGAMHRLRQRYRERLRGEVAQTVLDDSDVDDELRYLVRVVSEGGAP